MRMSRAYGDRCGGLRARACTMKQMYEYSSGGEYHKSFNR